ncbi:IS3 family transposase [Mucilaginibacter litoreus]|uniref:IS3 family transposase n=1 Tax=Mucilaginibacter litoreus TaxID=1048221 RepID=A0ABW3AXK0_9SPHI
MEQRNPRSRRHLCKLLGYSRQACYKQIKTEERSRMESGLLLAEVARIREVQPRAGGRKLLHMLQSYIREHKLKIGMDAFFELLREHDLLVSGRKRRVPRTTVSSHPYYKYANLVKGLTPVAPNQLWVSDITYIRLREGFAYLSLVTDAYSRKIVGFELSDRPSAKGCLTALKMALADNPSRDGQLIHHSDRGVQYCSGAYTGLLQGHRIAISMTQSGDPRENALAERVNGILKGELLQKRYKHHRQARPLIRAAIRIYNDDRPHSSINLLTPTSAHQGKGELKRLWKSRYKRDKEKEATADK